MCPFDCTAVAGSGKVGSVNQVNHASWVAVVTPTDRPKSVHNRCVIELFCSVVCVVTLPLWHFCWCMGFCHRTESDLFLFLLQSSNVRILTPLLSIQEIPHLPYKSRRYWDYTGIRPAQLQGVTKRTRKAAKHNSKVMLCTRTVQGSNSQAFV